MTEIDFTLPDVGEGLADAMVSRWLVAEGDPVVRMEPMVEIETAKSAVEIPSPVDGTMIRHGAAAGDTVEVGALLAVLGAPATQAGAGDRTPPFDSRPGGERPGGGEGRLAAGVDIGPASPDPTGGLRVKAAPTVRRRARRCGVELAALTGTGPHGRILMADLDAHLNAGAPSVAGAPGSAAPAAVRAPAAATPAGPTPDGASPAALPEPRHRSGIQEARTVRMTPMRAAIFETMTRAWATVPLITDMREADATGLTRARSLLREESGGVRITVTTLFCAVVIAALRRHPGINVWLDPDAKTLTYHEHVDLGVAVSVPNGLSVGVVRGADRLSLAELSEAITDLAARAREGRLSASEMTGATATVTSFGTHGGWFGTPLVIPPQVLIAGFGAVRDTVVAVDGLPVVRPTVPLSVSADHRVVDGAELSDFCSTVERFIAEPLRMLAV